MQLKILYGCTHLYQELHVQPRQFFFLLLKNSSHHMPKSEQLKVHRHSSSCRFNA